MSDSGLDEQRNQRWPSSPCLHRLRDQRRRGSRTVEGRREEECNVLHSSSSLPLPLSASQSLWTTSSLVELHCKSRPHSPIRHSPSHSLSLHTLSISRSFSRSLLHSVPLSSPHRCVFPPPCSQLVSACGPSSAHFSFFSSLTLAAACLIPLLHLQTTSINRHNLLWFCCGTNHSQPTPSSLLLSSILECFLPSSFPLWLPLCSSMIGQSAHPPSFLLIHLPSNASGNRFSPWSETKVRALWDHCESYLP